MADAAFVKATGLSKHFAAGQGRVIRAVDGVSLDIARGETLGLVGESACGKTTLGRLLLRLIEPTAGSILLDGVELTALARKELRRMRKRMQIIFQDPYSSLDPRMSIEATLTTPMKVIGVFRKKERERAEALLQRVGLGAESLGRYPHEFSGGQRQRIGIARALSVDPDFIVSDESVSALDVSIQAQILNLLKDLQRELGLTMLFISHDLNVVRYMSDRVMVMYLGAVVESAPRDDFYDHHLHPYTEVLLSSVPLPDPEKERLRNRIMPIGEPINPLRLPEGCRFYPRCPRRLAECGHRAPALLEVAPGHFVACLRHPTPTSKGAA